MNTYRTKNFLFVVALGLLALLSPFVSVVADSPDHDRIREEDRLGARSDEYSRAFDTAISALVRGDSATFRSLLSRTTTLNETRGPGAIDAIIQTVFIPFFENFVELTDSIATIPSYDAAGSQGMAMARSFTTSDGEQKSFVIYFVRERDKIMVGNLLPNMTAETLLQQKGKPAAKASNK
jgi:hypothetical protein